MSKAGINKAKQVQQKDRTANVLIVDNDPKMARFMLEILACKGIRGTIADDRKCALDLLDKDDYDLVFICDEMVLGAGVSPRESSISVFGPSNKEEEKKLGMSDWSECTFELLRKIKANSPELPVIMIGEELVCEELRTGIEKAVRAIRAGCCDFLIKPLDRKKIEHLLDTFLPNHSVSITASADQDTRTLYRIVGRSAKLLQTVDLSGRIAPTSAPVLISGESGTGKELISYLIHHKSKRSQGPFVKINCAALSDSLLESELFGHEKGAFTGAYTQRKGRFEMAHGGTLLLDEITETPAKFQAKLLRVLEQQDFERVGGNENVKINVRIISTTNKDLLQEVAKGQFRRDLYYRLSGVRLVIPPLRERREDLPDLVWHFVNIYQREVQRHIVELDPGMIDIFTKYHWPGNVRQLRNVVLTSLILGVGQTLSLADVSWLFDELQPLPEITSSEQQPTTGGKPNTDSGLAGISLEQIEQQAILDTLRQTAGNQTKAAKVLGISDRTLRDKIRRYRRQGCLQLT